MLVLTRKQGERINIGQDIVITVVQLDRNRVRIGIDAPDDVRILRQEILRGEEKSVAVQPAAEAKPAGMPCGQRVDVVA